MSKANLAVSETPAAAFGMFLTYYYHFLFAPFTNLNTWFYVEFCSKLQGESYMLNIVHPLKLK